MNNTPISRFFCRSAIRRRIWGDSRTARFAPCAVGVGTALTTGALRMTADKHWASDVIVGFLVGGTIGYFDTWGPFDLLRIDTRSEILDRDVRGLVVPYGNQEEVGVRLGLSF